MGRFVIAPWHADSGSPPAEDPTLAWPGDAVHAWWATLDVSDAIDLLPLLSFDERTRAGRFRFSKDRDRFIARRAMLRRVLGAYLRLHPARIRFTTGPHGKPEVDGATGGGSLRFNLSYSHGCAICAVTEQRRIGVDIEALRPIPHSGLILDQFGSPAEQASFLALRAEEREEAFLTWWTRKEAFVKAIGMGLGYPLRSCDVDGPFVHPTEQLEDSGPRYALFTFSPTAGYVASLALEDAGRPVLCRVRPCRTARTKPSAATDSAPTGVNGRVVAHSTA